MSFHIQFLIHNIVNLIFDSFLFIPSAALEMSCEVVIREKRSPDQPGYNKVVIVTDLTASNVLGRNNDGKVSYPFMWDDAKTGLRTLGVDGKWDQNSRERP